MKKQLLFLAMLLMPMLAWADAVKIDGIWYNLISKNGTNLAEVTSNPDTSIKYTGGIVIPPSVTHGGVSYSVTSIGYYAFNYCTGLTSVTIPNSVTSIDIAAFSNCSGLTSIEIPNSVTSIGNEVFSNCSGLTSIEIPNSVTSIGNSAFSGCSGLTSVTIPNSVTSIGYGAFYYCTGLTSVTIGNSVRSIGDWAFYECTGLTSVTIPNSVTSIGIYAFEECSGLTSVTIGNSVTSIGDHAFSWCSGLTSLTIPNSVTSIGYDAFYGCSGLTSVTIPNSVTYIGRSAFSFCSGLTSVTIGSGITSIGGEAFASCKDLADVYCHAVNVPNTNTSAFNDSYINLATLHVPAESVNAYKATAPWSGFKEVVALNGETPETQQCAKPTIGYNNGKLTFNCETEGAECVTTISDADIKTHYGNEVQLNVTYNISVYATKPGYDNSETATATLCWLNVEPEKTGITDTPTSVPERVLMLKTDDGTTTYYDINGRRLPAPQKGINIIRTKDGSTKKVVVK